MHLGLSWRPAAAAIVGLLAGTASSVPDSRAATWRIENGVSASATVTDNLRTAPDSAKQGGVILGQTGQTSIRADGNRADLALDLTLDLLEQFGGGERDFTFRQTGFGFGQAELVEDLFFVEGTVSAQQALTDPTQGVSANPLSDGRGRAQTYSGTFSPWLQGGFQGWAEGELRYRRSQIVVTEGIGDSSVDAYTAKLGTGERFDRLQVDALAEREVTDSESRSGDLSRTTFLTDARWFLIRQFAVTGSVGFERITAPSLADPPDGPIWTVGFYTRPGPRTELEASYGHRYGGPTWSGSGTYRITPFLVLRASYGESVETTQQSLLQSGLTLDPLTNRIIGPDGLPVSADLGFGLFNQAFRSKRATASLTGTYERTTATVSFTDQVRDFDLRADDQSRQLGIQVQRRLRPDLTGGVSLGFQTYDGPGTQDYRTGLFRVELTQDLARNLALTGAVLHSRRVSDAPGLGYDETAALVSIRYGF